MTSESLSARIREADAWFRFCGGAEVATGGFLDVDNLPPWDLWLEYVIEREPAKEGFDAYLVSRIPAAWVDRVSGGIFANPERRIGWAEDLKPGRLPGPR
jgi:hypothetical protein